MSLISDPILINKSTAKNRIMMPPLVCFNWADQEGIQTVDRAQHYGARAKGGTAIIVVEATAVTKAGRLADSELGLWEDEQITQFKNIAKACQVEGSLVLVQLVHAGMKTVAKQAFSASAVEFKNKLCQALTLDQIEKIKANFVAAAVRAYQAGLNGVEIHGAHGYLLNQFTSQQTNLREDKYGGTLAKRLQLSLEVVAAVREATSEDFIISYRLGVNDPTFKEDILLAQKLAAASVNLINVSSGLGSQEVVVSDDFEFSQITYLGAQIKQHVNVPVAAVYGIRYPEQARELLRRGYADIVAVGRGLLADPNWTNKALAAQEVNVCYHCKPSCKYGSDGRTCPWRIKERRGE